MPICKNDPKKSYTGDEPSPKGLGYCAHAEKVGISKKGKDGNMWVIQETKTGTRRWIKKTKKQEKSKQEKSKQEKSKQEKSKQEKSKQEKSKHPTSVTYFTHDNGSRPFLVCISKNEVNIYTHPDRVQYFDSSKDLQAKSTYVKKLATYKKPIKIFIGKSPRTMRTEFSGGIGKKYDGNSILLQIANYRYVYIGDSLYEFSTPNDLIKEYISPVGNNDVPYPVAIGDKNIYFMLDFAYVPINKFPKLTRYVKDDAYAYFYGHEGDEALSKYMRPMKYKIIQPRLI